MFKTRLISGIILVIVLIATVGTGGNVLFGLLAVVSLIGLTELYKVVEVQNKLRICRISGSSGLLCTALYGESSVYDTSYDCVFSISYGGICIYISKLQIRTGDDCIFWSVLCSSNVVLHLSDTHAGRWGHSCMADFLKFLGM